MWPHAAMFDACENPTAWRTVGDALAHRQQRRHQPLTKKTRDLIELALDALLALALIGALIFTVFAAIGFWSAR